MVLLCGQYLVLCLKSTRLSFAVEKVFKQGSKQQNRRAAKQFCLENKDALRQQIQARRASFVYNADKSDAARLNSAGKRGENNFSGRIEWGA